MQQGLNAMLQRSMGLNGKLNWAAAQVAIRVAKARQAFVRPTQRLLFRILRGHRYLP